MSGLFAASVPLLDRGPVWWPISEILAARGSARLRQLVGIWLVLVLASVAFGVLNVWLNWNGIALALGGIPFEVTIFPPFLFSVLIALWLGPTWAAIPIYLANLASALASGLAFPLAALFAVAGVMETLMLWASLVAVRVDPDLRRGRDLAWFAANPERALGRAMPPFLKRLQRVVPLPEVLRERANHMA